MGFLGWLKSLGERHQVPATSDIGDGAVSKELFYQILDLERSVIMFFTEAGGWVGANRAFFETFDFENIGAFRATHESVRELFEEEAEEVFTESDRSWLDYLRAHKNNGYLIFLTDREDRLRTFNARSRMVKQQGKPLYILELEDTTELEAARRQTVEVERLKSKFLANIGHEFRTPMNGILGFVELMEKSRPSEKQHEYLNMIHASARSLMSNIESLLDLAQMQSGRLKTSNSEFNPIAEFEELVRIYTISARDKNIIFNAFIDPKLPATLEGDIRKIKQILNNLVSNAVKFTRNGGRVTVEAKLVKRLGRGRCLVGFSVRDTGKGIPPEQLAIITQPFVAGEHADERLGVGLSLSHGLVNLLGGKLNIQSDEGKGSSFSFALEMGASPEQAMRMVDGKTVKVALLDDKRIDDANFLTLYLRSFGLNVIKVHMIDESIYDNAEMLYLVGTQEDSEWMVKLATYTRKCRVTFLLEASEKLQIRFNSVVDYALHKPLAPSQISHHLVNVYKLPKPVESEDNLMQGNRYKALVAEDNLINQRLIKILLQEYNFDVTTAINGDEAVKWCETEDFDIVFMDIDMPIKDGILATQEIKEQRNPGKTGYMPIIALTALAMEGDREHILDEGLDDYLSKPLTRDKLERILRKHMKYAP